MLFLPKVKCKEGRYFRIALCGMSANIGSIWLSPMSTYCNRCIDFLMIFPSTVRLHLTTCKTRGLYFRNGIFFTILYTFQKTVLINIKVRQMISVHSMPNASQKRQIGDSESIWVGGGQVKRDTF